MLVESRINELLLMSQFLDGSFAKINNSGNPIFFPTKHTKQSWASQRRAAKKKRKALKF